MSESFTSPLAGAQKRLDQLRAGGAWINSPLHLLDVILSGRNPRLALVEQDTGADAEASKRKDEQFDSSLKAIYGEIIVAASERYGIDFVSRASEGQLTASEQSGEIASDVPTQAIDISTGGARG